MVTVRIDHDDGKYFVLVREEGAPWFDDDSVHKTERAAWRRAQKLAGKDGEIETNY